MRARSRARIPRNLECRSNDYNELEVLALWLSWIFERIRGRHSKLKLVYCLFYLIKYTVLILFCWCRNMSAKFLRNYSKTTRTRIYWCSLWWPVFNKSRIIPQKFPFQMKVYTVQSVSANAFTLSGYPLHYTLYNLKCKPFPHYLGRTGYPSDSSFSSIRHLKTKNRYQAQLES